MMTVIIDLEIGNAIAVENWFSRNQIKVKRIKRSEDYVVNDTKIIVIPGACNSGALAELIRVKGFKSVIINHIENGGYILGICAGMHCLFSEIEEGQSSGLNILDGCVEKMHSSNNDWAKIVIDRSDKMDSLPKTRLKSITGRMYFNHSYYVKCNEKLICNSISVNGLSVPNLVIQSRVIGIQAHPEKSQVTGNRLLKILGFKK